jgi:hypothetical protein
MSASPASFCWYCGNRLSANVVVAHGDGHDHLAHFGCAVRMRQEERRLTAIPRLGHGLRAQLAAVGMQMFFARKP